MSLFFLVCDGHGGHQVAEFVTENLHLNILKQLSLQEDPQKAIEHAFLDMEIQLQEMYQNCKLDGGVGTTVALVLIIGNEVYVANVGDTEIVLCSGGKLKEVTKSHTLSNFEEFQRVNDVGGMILLKGPPRLGHPVWNSEMVNIGVTRAMGDFYFKDKKWIGEKESGLIAAPSITRWKLTKDDQFLLIASDGFWDVICKDEALECIQSHMSSDNNTTCEALCKLALSRNSPDNVTVMLVKFTSTTSE